MEKIDREILRRNIAKHVGNVVRDIVNKEQFLDDDIRVEVFVETPSCYVDDNGETHTGRLISVMVDFSEDMEDDE